MTQEIYTENIKEVLRSKDKIEKELHVKINNNGKIVSIDGTGEKEYIGLKMIEAINLGFSAERALLLNNEHIILQILNIKDLTKRNDLERVRARIIGTYGKTLANINLLTDCFIEINNNQVGIIGNTEDIETARNAVINIIQGSKQGSVYARLEKEKKTRKLDPRDKLSIKNEFKKRPAKR